MAGLSLWDSQNEQPDDFQRENLEALVRRSERFASLAEFVIHARKMSRRTARVKGVTLTTVHSSKGLEWDSVFVVSVNEGVMPHKRSSDPDEERRLMYVALSRARKYLWVSHYGKASFFVKMIPDEVRSECVERTFALTQPGAAA
jgi:DNA helicase-2/ATP-dependent DNA helicase PcrA